MTDTQTVTRKPFHPLLVALFAGLASLILNIPFFWVLQAPLSDPQYTFSTEIQIKELFDEGALWSVALFSASSVFLTLYGTRRCSQGFRSRHGRLALQMGAAFPFAASTLSPFLIADEFRWTESQFRDVYQSIFVLIAICFVIWVLISWKWQDPIVAERGCRYGMNFAIVALLFAIPAHAIATYPKRGL